VIHQSPDYTVSNGANRGVFSGLARPFIDDVEHRLERLSLRFIVAPSGQGLGNRVQEPDVALCVGGDYGIADCRKSGAKPLPLFVEDRRARW
jgi:hypothetical protein